MKLHLRKKNTENKCTHKNIKEYKCLQCTKSKKEFLGLHVLRLYSRNVF